MAIITINGVALPSPTEMNVGIMDLSKAERNANGRMLIERVATKRKLFLTYSFLTEPDLQRILNAISPTFFNVTYIDPLLAKERTMEAYCGDREIGVVDFINSVPRYKDFTVNFIER